MNNNRVREIIRESINSFLINEVDEGASRFVAPYQVEVVDNDGVKRMKWIRTPEEHKALVNAARQKKQATNPNYVPPKGPGRPAGKMKKIASFFNINPDNPSHIRRMLRSAWQPKLQSMYNLRDKLTGEFGVKNTQLALRVYGEVDERGNQKVGLLTKFNQLYQKLDMYTKDIEKYGNDMWSITSRLREFPQILNDVISVLWQLCERSKGLAGKLKIVSPELNANIISGYKTSKGLKDRPIFKNKNSKEMMELTSYLEKLAEFIEKITDEKRKPIDVGRDLPGIKTIRR